jgi:hypothetical protein
MRQHSNLAKGTAEKVVKDIRRATRAAMIGRAVEHQQNVVSGKPARQHVEKGLEAWCVSRSA